MVNENAKQIEYIISNKSHESEELAPEQYQLYSLYPNPFNPSLNIHFSLATPGNINISVYNSNGQEVESVLKNEYLQVGNYNFSWDAGKNPSGLYFVKLESKNFTSVKKALFLK